MDEQNNQLEDIVDMERKKAQMSELVDVNSYNNYLQNHPIEDGNIFDDHLIEDELELIVETVTAKAPDVEIAEAYKISQLIFSTISAAKRDKRRTNELARTDETDSVEAIPAHYILLRNAILLAHAIDNRINSTGANLEEAEIIEEIYFDQYLKLIESIKQQAGNLIGYLTRRDIEDAFTKKTKTNYRSKVPLPNNLITDKFYAMAYYMWYEGDNVFMITRINGELRGLKLSTQKYEVASARLAMCDFCKVQKGRNEVMLISGEVPKSKLKKGINFKSRGWNACTDSEDCNNNLIVKDRGHVIHDFFEAILENKDVSL